MNIKNTILKLLTAGVLFLPAVASAQYTITGMIDSVVSVVWYIADAVIVILWIVTGIMFLTAQGDPTKLASAKKALFAALIGTAIIIVAGSAVYLVNSAITF
jgi:uncharacterized membrane protein SirB2